MKAALYIRVSTSEQAIHGYSLPAQEALLREYAEQHDMTVYNVYADEGVSAAKALTKRKALLAMLDDAEKGKFQCILFKDITRWSRSSKNYWAIQDRLDKCKVGWISVQQPYLETLTPTGRFQVSVMLGTAQLESEQTGERVKFVQDSLLRQGYFPYGSICFPVGYKAQRDGTHTRLVPDEDTKETVKEMFARYLTCGSFNQISREYGMNVASARFILKNRIYIGEFRGISGFCEPLISEKDFETAQTIAKRNTRLMRNRGKYTFSSLGRCSCGAPLAAQLTDGHVYYRCHSCRAIISERRLEELFIEETETHIKDLEVAVTPQRKPAREAEKRKKLLDKMTRLNDLFIDGNITKSDYQSRKAVLEAQISDLEVKPRKIPAQFKGDWKTAYSALDAQKRNVLWRTVCDRFVLNEDKTVSIFFL